MFLQPETGEAGNSLPRATAAAAFAPAAAVEKALHTSFFSPVDTSASLAEGLPDYVAVWLLILPGLAGLAYAAFEAWRVSCVKLDGPSIDEDKRLTNPLYAESSGDVQQQLQMMKRVSRYIAEGASAFLKQEFRYMAAYIIVFSIILGFLVNLATMTAFIVGAITSIICGYLGMKIAVYANVRTCHGAWNTLEKGFFVALTAGSVMGFALVSLATLTLVALILVYRMEALFGSNPHNQLALYEAIAGYGLGGSSIALFARVGGGIYTKAADVGADLSGKNEYGMAEDDPRNPACIADNVGDNVGDIAGMGADLFGSLAEASCAGLLIAGASVTAINSSVMHPSSSALSGSLSPLSSVGASAAAVDYAQAHLTNHVAPIVATAEGAAASGLAEIWSGVMFPVLISNVGILGGMVALLLGKRVSVRAFADVEKYLKWLLINSTVILTPLLFVAAFYSLPRTFFVDGVQGVAKWWEAALCATAGLWAGLFMGLTTEYFTSQASYPVREIAQTQTLSAATGVIYGLALGFASSVLPVVLLAAAALLARALCGMYGVALAAAGMLSTLTVGLTVDAYGPISDNAGGIAEMAGLGEEVRARTDALDAAGNTTAAVGKGYAIGSAGLVSLALFGAYTVRAEITHVDVMDPWTFTGLLLGAALPYLFSALTMKSVGRAANDMVEECMQQFPLIIQGTIEPQYKRCIEISTRASLHEMLAPGALVLGAPVVAGILFGKNCTAGLLVGALVSGLPLAIASSNAGGAWDNAKKYIESGALGPAHGKGSYTHKNAVTGDTVGDPLKDTSGPSLNILVKLSAIISLVFGSFISEHFSNPQGGPVWLSAQ